MALNTKWKDLGQFRSIGVIVNFWERVEVGKNGVFDKNSIMFAGTIC
jgi:hypothetical protein